MADKVRKCDRRSVAPTRDQVTATNPDAKIRAPEETVMTPLHRRVSTYAIPCISHVEFIKIHWNLSQSTFGRNVFVQHKCVVWKVGKWPGKHLHNLKKNKYSSTFSQKLRAYTNLLAGIKICILLVKSWWLLSFS
jgi:hypothetical protein